jgi:signal peptidase I
MSPGTSETSDFYPPRAARLPLWQRRLRGLEGGLGRFAAALRPSREPDLIAYASIMPGLGHMLVGELRKSVALFCVYAVLLIWTSLFSSGSVWLSTTILFSYHQWLFTDCAAKAREQLGMPSRRGRELLTFSLKSALVLALVYHAAGQAVAHFGAVMALQSDRFAPLLNRGDRLLVLRQGGYRRGDMVYSAAHGGLERVVGLPGDEIAVVATALQVNGQAPSPDRSPFSNDILGRIFEARAVVPPDAYCVFFPSRSGYVHGDELLHYFMIPKRDLDGRLALRYSPEFTRFP